MISLATEMVLHGQTAKFNWVIVRQVGVQITITGIFLIHPKCSFVHFRFPVLVGSRLTYHFAASSLKELLDLD
jgi:hypothetical protein